MTTDPATLLDAAAARLRDALAAPDWCDRLEACGLVDRDVALALADWIVTAGADLWAHGPLCECGSTCHECDDDMWQPHVRRALAVARAILGPGWAFQQAAAELAEIGEEA